MHVFCKIRSQLHILSEPLTHGFCLYFTKEEPNTRIQVQVGLFRTRPQDTCGKRRVREAAVRELLPLWTTGDSSHGKQGKGPGIFPPEDRRGHLPTLPFLPCLGIASRAVPVSVLLCVSVHRARGRPRLGRLPGADSGPHVCAGCGPSGCVELSTTAVLKSGRPAGRRSGPCEQLLHYLFFLF